MLTLSNVPSGVTVEVPNVIDNGTAVPGDALRIELVDGAGSNGSGGGVGGLPEGDNSDVVLNAGFGQAVYEVTDTDPFTISTVAVPLWSRWDSDLLNETPAVGASQVAISLGPLSTDFESDDTAPVPRFLDASGDPAAIFEIRSCKTTLLFPFVSNQAGKDTRIVVSNASGIVAGSGPDSDSCTIHYHGELTGGGAAPVDQTSSDIASGDQLDFTLSAGNVGQMIPGSTEFEGYAMAVCDFAGASGRAIIRSGFPGIPQNVVEQDAEVVSRDLSSGGRVYDNPVLFFGYVSNQDGYDTEIVVANTTQDWFDTPKEEATCELNYFGQNAIATQTSTPIQGPDLLKFSLSAGNVAQNIAPALGFKGYVTVECGFGLARGLARVVGSDGVAFAVPPEPIQPPAAPLKSGPVRANLPTGTSLLLSHVSSREDFDTRIVVSNASHFPGSMTPQDGMCRLDYHGDDASPFLPTQVVSVFAGTQVEFLLSTGSAGLGISPADNFQGHLSVSCDFPGAHALAEIEQSSASTLVAAHAYNAEHLDLPRVESPAPHVYPFVEHSGDTDRRLILANTSLDAFGTASAPANCGLAFYGTGTVPPTVDVPLDPAESIGFVISDGLPAKAIAPGPNFSGFAVVDCDVPFSRAMDFRQPTPPDATLCDADGVDGIDRNDLAVIRKSRGETPTPNDPRDADGDFAITNADVQQCRKLCTAKGCKPAL